MDTALFLQRAGHIRRRHVCTMGEFTNRCAMVFLNKFPHLLCIRCFAHAEGLAASLLPFNDVFVLKSLNYTLDHCVTKASHVTKPFTKLFAHYVARIGSKIKLNNKTHLLCG